MDQYFVPEMLDILIKLVIIPVLGIIAKFIVSFMKSKIGELDQKIQNEALNKYILLAEDAIETAVISVNQTFVESMKKQGTFDNEAMAKSFEMARNRAMIIMSNSLKKALEAAYGDIDSWLDYKIEYYVNLSKTAEK